MPPLPPIPPDHFTDCMGRNAGGIDDPTLMDYYIQQLAICTAQRDSELHIVIEACVNPGGNTAPPRVIQACTELLDSKILQGRDNFPFFLDRARAFFAQGDKQRALDDYNEAIKLAPHNAILYYNRGVFFAAQSDDDAALRDFDTAIGIKSKLVPVLRQRAKLYQTRGNFTVALPPP